MCIYICTYIIYIDNVDIIYIAIIVENELSRETYTWEEIINAFGKPREKQL